MSMVFLNCKISGLLLLLQNICMNEYIPVRRKFCYHGNNLQLMHRSSLSSCFYVPNIDLVIVSLF